MTVRVTIGMCVKNSEKAVRQSIESIISQEYPMEFIQLIVVDGCSTDRTLLVINSVMSKTCLAAEIYSDNGEGLGTARQIVVNSAKGKYVIFVDADVNLLRNFVRNHVNFMEENPDVGVAFGKPMIQEGSLIASVWNLCAYGVGGSIGSEATIFRTEVLRQVGGFDTKIKGAAEDRDLIVRIRLNRWLSSVNKNSRFFHKHRENLRSFWGEQSWCGYGDHYFSHKHGDISALWWKFPVVSFFNGLRLALNAYQGTHKKLSFLIPPQMLLGNIAWWVGFVKGHKDGYGHEYAR